MSLHSTAAASSSRESERGGGVRGPCRRRLAVALAADPVAVRIEVVGVAADDLHLGADLRAVVVEPVVRDAGARVVRVAGTSGRSSLRGGLAYCLGLSCGLC